MKDALKILRALLRLSISAQLKNWAHLQKCVLHSFSSAGSQKLQAWESKKSNSIQRTVLHETACKCGSNLADLYNSSMQTASVVFHFFGLNAAAHGNQRKLTAKRSAVVL